MVVLHLFHNILNTLNALEAIERFKFIKKRCQGSVVNVLNGDCVPLVNDTYQSLCSHLSFVGFILIVSINPIHSPQFKVNGIRCPSNI